MEAKISFTETISQDYTVDQTVNIDGDWKVDATVSVADEGSTIVVYVNFPTEKECIDYHGAGDILDHIEQEDIDYYADPAGIVAAMDKDHLVTLIPDEFILKRAREIFGIEEVKV